MLKKLLSIQYFSALFVIVFLLNGCELESPVPDNKTKTLIRPAKLIEVGQINTNRYLNYPAVIGSQQLSFLSFDVGGVLTEILVVESQHVKQGEVLAKLDPRDFQVKLKSARAQYDNADAEYQRALRLIKEDAIARSIVEQRKSQHDVSKAQLETSEKALQDTVLVAPYDGNISAIAISKLQVVKAGQTVINILGRGGFEAAINLPSGIIATAKKHTDGKTYAYLTLDIAPDRRIPVLFKELSLEADAASQTYEVTFAFDPPKNLNILPGMNATVWFKDPRNSPMTDIAISIPLASIMTDGNQKYVWVVDMTLMTVSRRDLIIEDGVGMQLKVSSGLEHGETIVSAGVSSLSEGMKIRPWSE